MSATRYRSAFARSWYLVILAVIAGGAGGWYVYDRATPMYRATVRMIVSDVSTGSPGDAVASRTLATQRAQDLAEIANTAPAIDDAASAAGYPGSAPSVHASAVKNRPFVKISVSDSSAARAQAVANAFGDTLPATLGRLENSGGSASVAATNLGDAKLPAHPYSPHRTWDIGLGAAAGLLLGMLLALLREALNRRVRDSDDVEQLTGLTVLGSVPRELRKKLLPAVTDPRSARAEAYRQIRTTLVNNKMRELHTIAITSASLGEGKTSVAANLAAVFSRAGHRVAIVDADLRRPKVAAFFNLRRAYGLTEVLSGAVSLEQALSLLDDGRLAVLASGRIPTNPSEALGSIGMEQVLERLAEEFEYVVVDTPPVLPVTDASVVAPKVDGVVFVTRTTKTTRDRVRRALAALDRVNATVIGVVPNQTGRGSDRDYRYSYPPVRGRKARRAAAASDQQLIAVGRPHSAAEGGDEDGQGRLTGYRPPRQEPLRGRPPSHASRRSSGRR